MKSVLDLILSFRDLHDRPNLVLINGLAEQYESWYMTVPTLSKKFTLHVPNLYLYDGAPIHERLNAKMPADVPWLAERLHEYLSNFGSHPPYSLVGSSTGCQVILTYAAAHPTNVNRIILICPSGMGGEQNLPVVEGVSRSNYQALIGSIFYDKSKFTTPKLVKRIGQKFANKMWKRGFIGLVRGTRFNCVADKLAQVKCPQLIICGGNDAIVDASHTYLAVRDACKAGADIRMLIIPKCGHAPQIEKKRDTNFYIRKFMQGEEISSRHKDCRFLIGESRKKLKPFDLETLIPAQQAQTTV